MAPDASAACGALLRLPLRLPVKPTHAGTFVSSGTGRHPTRTIDSHELIFVRRGRLGLFEGDHAFDLGPGDVLLLAPGRRHGGTRPYPPDLVFCWLHFFVLEHETVPQAGDAPGIRMPQQVHLPHPARLDDLIRRYLNDQESGCLTPTQASLLLLLMLDEVAEAQREAVARQQDGQAGELLANRARQVVRTQFQKPIGTSTVARQLHCNPDYLGRVFRQAYGLSLSTAIQRQRVSRARALLEESPLNGKEIARACGFAGDIYFRRIFKRETGMTPTQFRRLYTRRHVNTI